MKRFRKGYSLKIITVCMSLCMFFHAIAYAASNLRVPLQKNKERIEQAFIKRLMEYSPVGASSVANKLVFNIVGANVNMPEVSNDKDLINMQVVAIKSTLDENLFLGGRVIDTLFFIDTEKDEVVGYSVANIKENYIIGGSSKVFDSFRKHGYMGRVIKLLLLTWQIEKWQSSSSLEPPADRMYQRIKLDSRFFVQGNKGSGYTVKLTSGQGVMALIKEIFPSTDRISFADLDTGTGEFVTNFRRLLSRYYKSVDAIGVELFQNLVDQARKNGHNVFHGTPEAEGDYEKAGLSDNSRDIVTINNIESRPWALIEQADRIAKENGLIVVTFEKYDIQEEHGTDKTVEEELKKRGYVIRKIAFPEDYPHSVTFEEADFILIAWKGKIEILDSLHQYKKINDVTGSSL